MGLEGAMGGKTTILEQNASGSSKWPGVNNSNPSSILPNFLVAWGSDLRAPRGDVLQEMAKWVL